IELYPRLTCAKSTNFNLCIATLANSPRFMATPTHPTTSLSQGSAHHPRGNSTPETPSADSPKGSTPNSSKNTFEQKVSPDDAVKKWPHLKKLLVNWQVFQLLWHNVILLLIVFYPPFTGLYKSTHSNSP